MNHALSLCEGEFVTHLDDDDAARSRTESQTLVTAALERQADFLWHPLWYENHDGTWSRLGDGRFELGQITTSSIFYHRYFARSPWNAHAYRPGTSRATGTGFARSGCCRPRHHFVDHPMLFHYAEQSQAIFTAYAGEQFLD